MKIVPIFAEEKTQGLFSVHFEGEPESEIIKAFHYWFDIGYLHKYFTTHQHDLNSGYYGENLSTQQAISYTREEAYELFENLKKLAVSGKIKNDKSLSLAFRPLHNGDYSPKELQKQKAKSTVHKKWLRIYAIKIAPNTFIVTGSAIKLVRTMNERPHLQKELQKLEDVKNYLKDLNICDQDDFEMLEF
jgi:hypothetical protein